ncbi:MAG: S-layer homology domain-containing protein, partial [Butyricicoccus sp.]
IWDGWTQQRCEWTPGTADAGQVEAMEELGYTVLFEGQDPEGQMRPAILYKEMENGGHYTYSAVVWDRQLQALTPGAYKLYANLISMGTEGSGNVGDTGSGGSGGSGGSSGGGSSSSGGSGGGGGGSSSSSIQKPVITTGAGGSSTLSSDGKTLTIKPDAGYEIKDVTVNGTSKGAVSTVTGLKTGDKVVITFAAAAAETDGHKCAAFTDISGHWGKDAICYAVENGLFSGVSATKFAPNDSMTRAMLVTVLSRMEGADYDASNVFSDVAADAWYAEAVAWAADQKVVSGVSATEFAPNANVTREQMAAILYRYATLKGYDVSKSTALSAFDDASAVSAYAQPALAWAVAEGLISGRTATTLAPQGTATRAEVASVLMRFQQKF